MAEKFTQGPWLIRKFTGEDWPEKRISIAEQGGGSLFINARYAENAEANAHLIACAPEMYEMLKMLHLTQNNHPYDEDIAKLLAKARGEKSETEYLMQAENGKRLEDAIGQLDGEKE